MTSIKGFTTELVAAALSDALAHRSPGRPCVFAVSGLQGSGKSTFAAQVAALADTSGLKAATLSIDDVYLTRDARQRLAREVHPLLATRGPASTHDLALAHATLDAVAGGRRIRLPRFDKLGDDRLPESQWPQLQAPLDLLVVEGWLLGTPAEAPAALVAPLNALERDEDHDGAWRLHCNTALSRDYPALWARLDRLWLLQAPGFEIIPEWRWQQEQTLQAHTPGHGGMSRAQVERFVQFYERTSRQALRTLPAIADRCIPLDHARHITGR